MSALPALLKEVRSCTLCTPHLPHGPRPVVQLHAQSRILIASQAPGRKVHDSGIPFDDVSGDRLRDWLGVSRELFYDEKYFAILPMGFCFPGSGKSGDLPPRPECAAHWRQGLLSQLRNLQLTLVIGQYAQAYHLPNETGSLTETVQGWRRHWPNVMPLPHPSPRNKIWFKRNLWFEEEVIPALRARVSSILADAD